MELTAVEITASMPPTISVRLSTLILVIPRFLVKSLELKVESRELRGSQDLGAASKGPFRFKVEGWGLMV
jgi:hypothetical protein